MATGTTFLAAIIVPPVCLILIVGWTLLAYSRFHVLLQSHAATAESPSRPLSRARRPSTLIIPTQGSQSRRSIIQFKPVSPTFTIATSLNREGSRVLARRSLVDQARPERARKQNGKWGVEGSYNKEWSTGQAGDFGPFDRTRLDAQAHNRQRSSTSIPPMTPLSPFNAGFDTSLRRRNPTWSEQDLEVVLEQRPPPVPPLVTVQGPATMVSRPSYGGGSSSEGHNGVFAAHSSNGSHGDGTGLLRRSAEDSSRYSTHVTVEMQDQEADWRVLDQMRRDSEDILDPRRPQYDVDVPLSQQQSSLQRVVSSGSVFQIIPPLSPRAPPSPTYLTFTQSPNPSLTVRERPVSTQTATTDASMYPRSSYRASKQSSLMRYYTEEPTTTLPYAFSTPPHPQPVRQHSAPPPHASSPSSPHFPSESPFALRGASSVPSPNDRFSIASQLASTIDSDLTTNTFGQRQSHGTEALEELELMAASFEELAPRRPMMWEGRQGSSGTLPERARWSDVEELRVSSECLERSLWLFADIPCRVQVSNPDH